MALNINGLESYFPVPSVTHADETVDSTVRQLAALNSATRLVLLTPTRAINVTFDGSDPVKDGHGVLYGAGEKFSVNEVTAAAIKWVLAYTGDTDGTMTVMEFKRT